MLHLSPGSNFETYIKNIIKYVKKAIPKFFLFVWATPRYSNVRGLHSEKDP
jgi:hypothetical protein